jgi:RNA polymerase sigma-70 factor, ECF subfamily
MRRTLVTNEEPEKDMPSLTDDEIIEASDRSLLRRFRGGDDDAATQIYLKYAERLMHLAENKTGQDLKARLDPEDMVQSVFRTFFRRVSDGQYDVPEGDELWKLLLVIGLNKIRNLAAFHRADKRTVKRTQGELDVDGSAVNPQSDQESLKVLEMTIRELLSPLPEEYQKVIELRVAGFEVQEIAEKSGRSKRTVERILQEFRRKLGGLIDEQA